MEKNSKLNYESLNLFFNKNYYKKTIPIVS